MFFKWLHNSTSANNPKDAATLASAARAAYQTALNERLPLAYIAEQSGRAQYWFANNIVQIVDVFGSPPGQTNYMLLTREITSTLKLSDDMTSLTGPDSDEPSYIDLRSTKEQFERYIKWARTVY